MQYDDQTEHSMVMMYAAPKVHFSAMLAVSLRSI